MMRSRRLRRKVATYVNHTCFQVGLWLQIRSPRLRVCRIRREEGQVNRLRGIRCNVQEIKRFLRKPGGKQFCSGRIRRSQGNKKLKEQNGNLM